MLGRIRRLPWRFIVPWFLFVLATGAAVTFAVLWQQEVSEDRQVDEVTDAARSFVHALTNFSSETIDADAARIKAFAVGEFSEEAETFFGERAVAAIREAQATSEGEIEALFLQSVDDEQASVFAVVSATVSNQGLTEPRTDTLRLEVGMIKTASGWKVNRVDVFQSPGGGVVPPVG